MTVSNNYPAEFYGKLVSAGSAHDFIPVFQLQECPFIGKRCIKQRKSDPHQTIGACTVRYQIEPLMICPLRFVQGNQIFRDCIQLLKPDLQYFVVPEVAMPGGSIDYFLVAHLLLTMLASKFNPLTQLALVASGRHGKI